MGLHLGGCCRRGGVLRSPGGLFLALLNGRYLGMDAGGGLAREQGLAELLLTPGEHGGDGVGAHGKLSSSLILAAFKCAMSAAESLPSAWRRCAFRITNSAFAAPSRRAF